jgi:hypothetical protein
VPTAIVVIPFPVNGNPAWQRILRVMMEVHNNKEVGP